MVWTEDGDHRFENWALGGLAVVVVLIASYAVLTHQSEGPVGEAELAGAMPDGYEPVLSALIRASGQECDKLCSASLTEPVVGTRRVHASCAVAARHISCAQAVEFEVNVAPVPQPSR